MSNEVLENGVDIRTLIAEVIFNAHDIVLSDADEDAKKNALQTEERYIKLLNEFNKEENAALEADIRLENEKEVNLKKLELEERKINNEEARIELDRQKMEQEKIIEERKIVIAEKAQELEIRRLENEEIAEKNRSLASKLTLGLQVINIITNVFGLKASKDVVMGTLALNFSDNCMRDKDSYVAAKKAMDDVLKKIGMK